MMPEKDRAEYAARLKVKDNQDLMCLGGAAPKFAHADSLPPMYQELLGVMVPQQVSSSTQLPKPTPLPQTIHERPKEVIEDALSVHIKEMQQRPTGGNQFLQQTLQGMKTHQGQG